MAEVPLRCAERWCNLGQLPLIVMDLHGSLSIAMGMFAGSLLQEGKLVSHSLFGCDLDWIAVSHHKWLDIFRTIPSWRELRHVESIAQIHTPLHKPCRNAEVIARQRRLAD